MVECLSTLGFKNFLLVRLFEYDHYLTGKTKTVKTETLQLKITASKITSQSSVSRDPSL